MKKFLYILSLFLFILPLYAKDVSNEEKIAALYVAFFNRAPDFSGFSYWKNQTDMAEAQGKSSLNVLKELAGGFAQHPVFITTYGALDNEAFVRAIYRNTLAKEGDEEGINYWTQELQSMSRSDMVALFIDASLSLDLTAENFPTLSQSELQAAQLRQDLLTNKANVALAFVNILGSQTEIFDLDDVERDPAYKASIKIVVGVSEVASSADEAISYLQMISNEDDPIHKILNEWMEKYLLHKNITTTIFWIGEESSSENGYIPNLSSAWDDMWMQDYGGIDTPDKREGYHPAQFTPQENSFYFALPFNDFDANGERKADLESYIPWSIAVDTNVSVVKNRWIKIIKGDKVAYAQWEDVGPFGEDDKEYVFAEAQPLNAINQHAGLDLSPALRDYLQLSDIDQVDWQFVDESDVAEGPWKEIITTSGIRWIDWYKPSKYTSWQWQLTGDIDISYDAKLYDIDLFDTDPSVIQKLHEEGKKVICYFSAGSYEEWREDASLFLESTLGNELDGWEGERWLDIRDETLHVIMRSRLDLAKAKGCDGVEPDNVDGYTNSTGFPLGSEDQLEYNKFLAKEAHIRGLAIGLKNDLKQIEELEPFFDFALNEQCHFYDECSYLEAFLDANKAVFNAEYDEKYLYNQEGARDSMCKQANAMGMRTLILPRDLDNSFRYSCIVDNIKSRWIKDAFQTLESDHFSHIKAISWWNEKWDEDGFDINIRMDSSPQSLYRYQEMVHSQRFVTTPVIENFKLLPDPNGIYHSAFPDFGAEEENITIQQIEEFESLADKKIVWAYFSNNWIEGIVFPLKDVETISQSGKIPFIRIMPRSKFGEYEAESLYSMQKIIDGTFDEELRLWAIAARDTGIPLLAEFGTEVNGMWFPWNGYYNGADTKDAYGDVNFPDGPERFRDAYRHIIDICRQNGVNNITWFFHINAYGEPFEEWNLAKNYYPGDDYIDWLGVSIYGLLTKEGRYQNFQEILSDVYPELVAITDKPIAILEFGIREIKEGEE